MSSISINIGDVFLIDTPPNGQHFMSQLQKLLISNGTELITQLIFLFPVPSLNE